MLLFSLSLLSSFFFSLSLFTLPFFSLFTFDFQLRSWILDYSVAGLSLVERIEI